MRNTIRASFQVAVLRKRWLTGTVFEVGFERPKDFSFIPGQKVSLTVHDLTRQYTLINQPDSSELTLCVSHVPDGRLTPMLSQAKPGALVTLSAASGFFAYQSLKEKAVFVATGTGIAPFLAFVRNGVRDFICLQGAISESELLYRDEVEKAAGGYIPCLSAPKSSGPYWNGHVTAYLEKVLAKKVYDFYLCGNGDMIRDAIRIVDQRFPDSRVFIETFS